MSRFAQAVAPILKLLLVVAVVAAWVEANAQWIRSGDAPAPASAATESAPAPAKGECPAVIDRRNATPAAPLRPAVIRT